MDMSLVKFSADLFGWREVDYQPNIQMVSFKRGEERINVYLTTRTVATAINHPVKGKTQLYRRNVSQKQLAQIFQNPRVHTGKGYFQCRKIPFARIVTF